MITVLVVRDVQQFSCYIYFSSRPMTLVKCLGCSRRTWAMFIIYFISVILYLVSWRFGTHGSFQVFIFTKGYLLFTLAVSPPPTSLFSRSMTLVKCLAGSHRAWVTFVIYFLLIIFIFSFMALQNPRLSPRNFLHQGSLFCSLLPFDSYRERFLQYVQPFCSSSPLG
jgi:hypothetical protein